jgi:hypothetical protein
MRNTSKEGTIAGFADALRRRLPQGWRVSARALGGARRADSVVWIDAPDGSRGPLVVEEKKSLDPRDVPSAILRLQKAAAGRPLAFTAPFLSWRTRQLLRDAAVSYADATGNIRLLLQRPGLFIEAQGSEKDPRTEPRPLRSLKGPVAGRVVRALCDFQPPYGVRELANKASTALGSVARVVGFLDREAVVERDEDGRIERVRRPELVRRWTQDYGLQRSNEVMGCLAPRGIPSVLEGLRRRSGYCITASLAASRRFEFVPSRLAAVFAEDPASLARDLAVRETDVGANILLLRPYDRVVFERTWREDGLVFAALSQVAADLLTSPGRGPSEGEELLRWMGVHVDGWRA